MKRSRWYAKLIVSMVVVLGLVIVPMVSGEGLQGDVNGDGVVNYDDVLLLERIIIGAEPAVPAADVNGDGEVNMGDITALELIILGNPGDANLDGEINMGDVTEVERIILTIDPPVGNADANEDGDIDMGDVTRIERMILGIVSP